MSRKRRKQRQKSTQSQPVDAPKRDTLKLLRNLAIATPVVGVAGFFSVRSVQARICEADLTKIGKGKPAIVQIHDPGCQMCQTLQRQTRRALKAYDGGRYTFLVANINTADGGALAAQYGVPHVTLLLFDGNGAMTQIVRGPTDTDALENILAAHMKRHG